MSWHIGCSGFHYKEWKNAFYPEKMPQKKWFEYYATHFKTLELNVTFYRFPQVAFLKNWYDKSPAGFTFSVKVPRLITHYKIFSGCTDLLSDFYTTARDGLGDKLGCILFQLPSKIVYTPQLLDRILCSIDNSFLNVIEFRHKSWWSQEVYDILSKHHIAFCGISHPDLPDDPVINTDFAYYRFHGVPNLYYSEYNRQKIRAVTDKIMKAEPLSDIYVYFNNTAAMAAIHNANQMKRYAGMIPAV